MINKPAFPSPSPIHIRPSLVLHSIDHLYFQASHPPGEERAAHRVARPAAAPRDRAKERAVREDLQRPHLAVQPNPDAGN